MALGDHRKKACTGWLDGFENRNCITLKKVIGEIGNVKLSRGGKSWKDDVVQMIEETPAKDIFNVNKTYLHFKFIPDKT